MSPQLSCGDTWKIWTWLKLSNLYFCKIKISRNGEINKRGFSNPHPRPTLYLSCHGSLHCHVTTSHGIWFMTDNRVFSFRGRGISLFVPSHCRRMRENENISSTLLCCHNGHDGVSNHQPYACLLNCPSSRRSKKISKLCVTGLCAGNSPEIGEFPAQMASNAENVSIWWRHHEFSSTRVKWLTPT